jgi:TatD DNase family protein
MLVDSHCHLADEAFAPDLKQVADRAQAAGVQRALCILSADEPDEVERCDLVRTAWPAVVFGTAVHPHRAKPYAGRALDAAAAARAAVGRSRAVAVGEIGLDYHYDFSPRDVQREVFAAQVELALQLNRPVIIHTREATDDTIAVLRDAGAGRVRGVMHCFTGSVDEARLALDLGIFISHAGIVTFPKTSALREVAAFVPDDRLLIETDAPYLAPVPHRGRRNEPAFLAETLDAVARVRQVDPARLSAIIVRNFDTLFRVHGGPDLQVRPGGGRS